LQYGRAICKVKTDGEFTEKQCVLHTIDNRVA
jgi:hypothetical protein